MRTIGNYQKHLAVVLLTGCVFTVPAFADDGSKSPAENAVATLRSSSGESMGEVVFSRKGEKVELSGEISKLSAGQHGFHVHEFGDCSAVDFKSAGGHFNPAGHDHGGPEKAARHVGDLGNVTANSSGIAKLATSDSEIRLHGEHSIVGRAVVVHEKADDLSSQPSGDAGARVACGVIGLRGNGAS